MAASSVAASTSCFSSAFFSRALLAGPACHILLLPAPDPAGLLHLLDEGGALLSEAEDALGHLEHDGATGLGGVDDLRPECDVSASS